VSVDYEKSNIGVRIRDAHFAEYIAVSAPQALPLYDWSRPIGSITKGGN